MKLIEILQDLDELDEDLEIFVKPGSPISADTEASLGLLCAYPGTPQPSPGHEPFLGVPLAQEAVETWSERRNGKIPTLADKLAAILYFASHDDYL